MTREEMWQKAKEARKEEKEREKNKGDFKSYDPINFTALEEKKYHIMRLLGNFPTARDGDPYAAKIVRVSKLNRDNGKSLRIIWPENDENWVFSKIYYKVLSGKWNNDKKIKIYDYQDKYPDVFNRVFKNGTNNKNTFDSGWRPKEMLLVNVIDRNRMEWHRENKKTLVLSKNAYEKEDGTLGYEFGISSQIFKRIFDDIAGYAGPWEDYDVIMQRLSTEPYYKAFHAVDDLKKIIEEKNLFRGVLDYASLPLSEEELSWERQNIDSISQISSYTKIYNGLKVFVQEVDATFKTHFFEELEQKVEIEKKAWEEQKKNTGVSHEENDEDEDQEQDTSTSSSSEDRPVEVRSRPQSVNNNVAPDWIALEAMGFKGIKELTPEEKANVISFDKSKGTFVYKNVGDGVYACANDTCKFPAPSFYKHCPKCGDVLPDIG